jgi:hypothetical protein
MEVETLKTAIGSLSRPARQRTTLYNWACLLGSLYVGKTDFTLSGC